MEDVMVPVYFCLTFFISIISTNSSLVFHFEKDYAVPSTYIARIGEYPVLSCPHMPGESVNINVETTSDTLPIVINSELNNRYEGKFSIMNGTNSTDITVLCPDPEINGSEIRCVRHQDFSLRSLRVIFIPFDINYAKVNEGTVSVQTYCSVDVEFETSCFTKPPTFRKINNTHCEKSLEVECSSGEQCYINGTIVLSNVQNINPRHLNFGTICPSHQEKTTNEMSILTSKSDLKQTVTANTAGNGKSQISPWICIGLAAAVTLYYFLQEL